MKTVGTRELKNKLGQCIAHVRRGQSLIITIRGEAVAKLSPICKTEDSNGDLRRILEDLAAEGKIRLATKPLRRFRPVPGRGQSASSMIIEDRR